MIKESKYFISEFDESDTDTAERFIRLLEEKYDKIHGCFGFEPKGTKYKFCLCANAEDYIKETGRKEEEYQPWMVGSSDFAEKKICVITPSGGNDEDYLEKVAVHELVHMIFDEQTGIAENEAWIAEGIAIFYAGQTEAEYVSRENFPRISEISGICENGDTPDNFIDNGGYDYAGIYVGHYIKTYGFDTFIKAYKNEISPEVYSGFEKEAIEEYLGNDKH